MQSEWTTLERSENVGATLLRIDSIRPGDLGIRSELGDLDSLKESILQQGLLTPIIVGRRSESSYEVIAGNRRLKVFQQLSRRFIPAVVVNVDEKSSFEISLTENIQRQTLDPLDEARAFYNYVSSKKKHGLGYGSVSELAKRIGKSQEYISNRMGLLRLPELTLRRLLRDGNLKVSHAEELASLSDNLETANELAKLVSSNKISVRVLEKAIHFIKAGVPLPKALELASTESNLKLKTPPQDVDSDRPGLLMKRTKLVLEATLSYVDNVLSELDPESDIYDAWTTHVRLPVHKAIDGVIRCQTLAKDEYH